MGLSSHNTGSNTAIDNSFSNLAGTPASLLNSGDYGNISVQALGLGMIPIFIQKMGTIPGDCKK